LGLDLELHSVLKWELGVVDSLGVDLPALAVVVVAVIPSDDLAVDVVVALNSETSASGISDVSVLSSVEGSLLVDGLLVRSPELKSSLGVVSHLVVFLSGENKVSLAFSSDGLGSGVEDPPLCLVPWGMVLESDSEVVSVQLLVVVQGSSTWQS